MKDTGIPIKVHPGVSNRYCPMFETDYVEKLLRTYLSTRAEGDRWVPTFPNATYLMPRRDFEYWAESPTMWLVYFLLGFVLAATRLDS